MLLAPTCLALVLSFFHFQHGAVGLFSPGSLSRLSCSAHLILAETSHGCKRWCCCQLTPCLSQRSHRGGTGSESPEEEKGQLFLWLLWELWRRYIQLSLHLSRVFPLSGSQRVLASPRFPQWTLCFGCGYSPLRRMCSHTHVIILLGFSSGMQFSASSQLFVFGTAKLRLRG